MFSVLLHGRMGNQMFQFAFAYLYAKKSNQIYLLEFHKNKRHLNLFKLSLPFRWLHQNNIYRIYAFLIRKIHFKYSLDFLDITRSYFPIENLKDVFLSGYFQEASFFEEHKKDLLKIFQVRVSKKRIFDRNYSQLFSKNKTMVVSMRLGDDYKKFTLPQFENAPVFLPNKWYKDLICELSPHHDLVIVISDKINEARNILGGDDSLYYFLDDIPEMQYQALLNADTCVIGNSSYSWWGAFLNNKPSKRVYAPMNWLGYNIGVELPVGIMTKEFIWV